MSMATHIYDTSYNSSNPLIGEYEDVVDDLVLIRRTYKDRIVKYKKKIFEVELSNLKKTKYKNTNAVFPESRFKHNLELSNITTKELLEEAQRSTDITDKCKELCTEVQDLKQTVEKMAQYFHPT